MSFAGYPHPATGVPAAVHITQPQISARSYCWTRQISLLAFLFLFVNVFFRSAKNCWESSSDRTSESTETEASHKRDL